MNRTPSINTYCSFDDSIWTNLGQLANKLHPIDITDDGIVMLISEVQEEKA